MSQQQINFNRPIVHSENNNDSQRLFEKNEKRFRGQCKIIMDAFRRGERLTVVKAMQKYRIGDLRRRIKDLKDNYGVDNIKSEMIGHGFKEWYLKQGR
jgi:translation initiation factor 1 (eIF-1/SUI1)